MILCSRLCSLANPGQGLGTLYGLKRPRCVSAYCSDVRQSAPILCEQVVVLGIDPDSHGALSCLVLDGQTGEEPFSNATVDIFDVPIELIKVGKKNRRRIDSHATASIVEKIMERGYSSIVAFLEAPTIMPLDGKYSYFNTGYGCGVWRGVLSAHGIEITNVFSRRWKSDLQLIGKGKEGSLEMARELFPSAECMLRRKKDHGRAESLLIAAWGAGFRVPKEKASDNGTELVENGDAPPADKSLNQELEGDDFVSDSSDASSDESLEEVSIKETSVPL